MVLRCTFVTKGVSELSYEGRSIPDFRRPAFGAEIDIEGSEILLHVDRLILDYQAALSPVNLLSVLIQTSYSVYSAAFTSINFDRRMPVQLLVPLGSVYDHDPQSEESSYRTSGALKPIP